MALTIHLPDGRPIDEEERIRTLKEISDTDGEGVTGAHMERLTTIFDANQTECQQALKVTKKRWDRSMTLGQLEDPALAILVRWYLTYPDTWPIRYVPTPDLDAITEYFGDKRSVPMLVARSQNAIYRWAGKPPSGYVRVLLSTLENFVKMASKPATQTEGNSRIADLMKMINEEASIRGVDIEKDQSWNDEELD